MASVNWNYPTSVGDTVPSSHVNRIAYADMNRKNIVDMLEPPKGSERTLKTNTSAFVPYPYTVDQIPIVRINVGYSGYVYVLSNEAYPNIYKIGSTYGLPEERAEELTGTGHLTPFKVVGKIKVQSAEYYEKSIHKLLNKFRVKQGREFFKLDLPKIKECLKQVSNISEKGSKKITLAKMQKVIKF